MKRWLAIGLVALLTSFLPCWAAAELSCADRKKDIGEWVQLTSIQSPEDAVLDGVVKGHLLSRTTCAEAIFTESGLDVVTESQWSLVLQAVIGSAGVVERFRIVYRPKLGIDFEAPVAKAIAEWRFEPAFSDGKQVPFCTFFSISKPMGSRSSDTCLESHETEAEPDLAPSRSPSVRDDSPSVGSHGEAGRRAQNRVAGGF